MRVAIIHYWLTGMRGGERVVEALCDLFPQADIFTHAYDPAAVSEKLRKHTIKTSFVGRLPRAARLYKAYLPLMPMALEQLDLRGYDLIISSESGPAKGIIPPPNSLHICYCHSPMRYIWNMFHDYRERSGFLARFLMPPVAHYLRNWDALAATRVHHFVANSHTVAHRLRTYYGRSATVIYPPVRTGDFECLDASKVGDYYLMAGELVRYKRPDLVVEAFNRRRDKLVVIGGGPMLKEIRAAAGPNISVLGPRPFATLRSSYARCRALIFPGEEDFGMVPVEAMASGRPVVAFGRGGATESVIEGVTGTFFHEQTVEAILDALDRHELRHFVPERIAAHAQRFGLEQFIESMRAFIDEHLANANHGITDVSRWRSRASSASLGASPEVADSRPARAVTTANLPNR